MFSQIAPDLYARGLAAIPLYPRMKKPIPTGWGLYSKGLPPDWQQEQWIAEFPDANIGCVMGAASNLIAIDLDSTDVRVVRALNSVIGHLNSPWVRIGAKGSVRLFGYTEGIRTARINVMIEGEDHRVVEILGKGTQIVLPPSIHPDTKKPYTANVDLKDVVDRCRAIKLPMDLEERIRSALTAEGLRVISKGSFRATSWVPKGSRDVTITSHAGLLARDVQRGARTLSEAIAEMRQWVLQYVATEVGDDITGEAGVEKLLRFIRVDIEAGGRKLPVGWDKGLTLEEVEKARTEFGLERDQLEQIPAEELVETLRLRLAEVPEEDYEARHAALSNVLDEIAKSNSLSEIQRTSIIAKVSSWVKDMKLTPAALNKEIKRRQAALMGVSDQGGFEGASHTEIARALAKQLENQYGEVRGFNGRLWRWMGACWKPLENDVILQIIAENYGEKCPAARRFSDHKGILDVYRRMVEKPLVVTECRGANFANGLLGLDGKLHEHSPDFGRTSVLSYRYNAGVAGNCPQFFNFLEDCWGHEADFHERVEALRGAIALTLVNDTWRYETVFCLYGRGGSGKSTLMNIILGLVSDEDRSACPPSKWDDKFEPAGMLGKTINLCGELSEKDMIKGDVFKEIVSGETITVQEKYVQPAKVAIQATHWFASNHLPRTMDHSDGFWRRWVFWSFNKAVDRDDKIIRLDNVILGEEREAIAAWAVESLVDVTENQGLAVFPSSAAVILKARMRSDTVLWFLEDCCIRAEGEKVEVTELFARYRSMIAVRGGGKPVSYLSFINRLQDCDYVFSANGKHLLDVKVKPL